VGFFNTQNQNEKSLIKQKQNGPKQFGGLLFFIGNPFFKLLLFLTISAFTTSLLIIKLIRVLLLSIYEKYFRINDIYIRLTFSTDITPSNHKLLPNRPSAVEKIPASISQEKVKITRVPILFITLFTLVTVLIVTGGAFFWTFILEDIPPLDNISNYRPDVSAKIYDRNGILLYKIYKDKNRTMVDLDDVPKHVIDATLAIEDNEFYSHNGISIKGIFRSIVKNFKEKKLYGGSTITQQLVKNILLSSEKTYIRKVKEMVLAMEVEKKFDKKTILEMYLNEVSFGGTVYGIEEASQNYFGKSVQNLSISEGALLAGIPKSPSTYSPFIGSPEVAKLRQVEVLDLMLANGYITPEQHIEAVNEKLAYAEYKTGILAPHFVMYVKKYLEDKYGEDAVEKGGLSIITTLDYKMQIEAEKSVLEEIENLGKFKVTNGAALVTNPTTGEILAMVGSKNYFDIENKGNVNAVFSLRPPGSTIKALNYSYALSNGYIPSTVINDSPISFSSRGSNPYTPKNYDGKFVGNLTVRNAFAQSRNVPAVKVLNSYGVQKMHDLGISMGIKSWNNLTDYGLSLTLGGGNVTLYELAQAYSVFANYGTLIDFDPILSVKDYKGHILQENTCANPPSYKFANKTDLDNFKFINPVQATESAIAEASVSYPGCPIKKILDPRVAFIITDILRDNIARTPSFGSRSKLVIKDHPEVAVKTGTSNGPRDNLTVGYTKDFLVAVWVGNNDNTPMSGIASGVTGATPIFNNIMTRLLSDKPVYSWEIPQGLKKIATCHILKKTTPEGYEEINILRNEDYYFEENLPKNVCTNVKNVMTSSPL